MAHHQVPGKPVIITRPDGTEVMYESQSAGARAEGIHQTFISLLCRGEQKQHKGYRARWQPQDVPQREDLDQPT